jgi:repressor LexA
MVHPKKTAPLSDGLLTPRQREVLELIQRETARDGRPPTYRAIAQELGLQAIGTVQSHLRVLIRKGYLTKDAGKARSLRLAHRSPAQEIPILGRVPAGRPLEALESAEGTLHVPARWKGDHYALRVTGESMLHAGILDGDYVVVKRQSHAENGEIVVAMIDGEATVKYLQRKLGKVFLLPANPRFRPIEVPEGSEHVIQGKVVSVQRFFG